MQWPPKDPKLAREASSLLADIDRAHQALADHLSPRGYMNLWDMLGRLVSIALIDVPDKMQQFWGKLNDFINALPRSSITGAFLRDTFQEQKKDSRRSIYVFTHHLYWIARWCSIGCPAVTIESNLAASLMATETSEDAIHEVKLPWDCFMVRLPRDLVELGELNFTHVAIHRHGGIFDKRWVKDMPAHKKERATQFYERNAGELWSVYGVSDEQIVVAITDLPDVLIVNPRPAPS